MKKKNMWLCASIIWCIAIFAATASPSSTGGNTQAILQALLGLTDEQASLFNFLFRKGVHLGAFGLLALLFFYSFEQYRYVLSWTLTTMYAASDEIHQAFVPSRTASIMDVGLDSLGALLVLCTIWIVHKKGGKKYEKT
ncbi:MAG TPA: VanZ family protein, partial [Bacillaceae bacterium]